MVLWHAGLTLATVWSIFRDPAIDYRLVVAGALLPDVVDLLVVGRPGPAHTLVVSALLLSAVMVATRGRRRLRRRLLALPVGSLVHLVLDGVWARASLLWWPFLGTALPVTGFRPSLAVVIVEEVLGALALAWFVRRFRLLEEGPRRAFLRTGRLSGAVG